MISHKAGVSIAVIIAICVLIGIVTGTPKIGFPINPELTYSKLFIAIWSGGLPLWYLLEGWWWPPDRSDKSDFLRAQRAAQLSLTFIGSVLIAIAS